MILSTHKGKAEDGEFKTCLCYSEFKANLGNLVRPYLKMKYIFNAYIYIHMYLSISICMHVFMCRYICVYSYEDHRSTLEITLNY